MGLPRPWRAGDHRRLYEIDTRAWLAELSVRHGRPIRLGEVTEADLAPIVELGFDLVWLMGVWETGTAGRRLWRASPNAQAERARLLPDGSDADIAGSPLPSQSTWSLASSAGKLDSGLEWQLQSDRPALILVIRPEVGCDGSGSPPHP